MSDAKIRVAIVDDHRMILNAFTEWISGSAHDVDVVAAVPAGHVVVRRLPLREPRGVLLDGDVVDAHVLEPRDAVAAPVEPGAARGAAEREVHLPAGEVEGLCRLDATALAFARTAAERLGWSARSLHRVLKLARTIADLAGQPGVGVAELAEAIQYRRALPGAAG